MKVLQVGKFYPVAGGVEKVMIDLLQGISQRGIPCDMLCTNTCIGEADKTIVINENARVICKKALTKKAATMIAPGMISELKRICNDYDIIHVHHPDPMAALALRCSGYKGKVIVHWHSDILSQRCLLKFYMPLQNWLIRRADLIVGTTPVYVEESPFLKKVQAKCTYLPIGVSPLVWNEEKVARIRHRYEGKKIVFSLGRLVHYKGFEYLIDAAASLPDNYLVLIGGDGELRKNLERQIKDKNQEDKVILLGRIADEDIPDYFRACDVFCLSSIQKTEAFAIVQIEAMACGRPVVATKISGSGVAWVNADGVSGLNVLPEDAQALSDAIVRMMEDKGLYAKLATGAKERYDLYFRKETMIERCIDIYNHCLSQRSHHKI